MALRIDTRDPAHKIARDPDPPHRQDPRPRQPQATPHGAVGHTSTAQCSSAGCLVVQPLGSHNHKPFIIKDYI